MNTRDARLHAFRADRADERLKGEVTAERFVPGRPARVATPVADVRTGPRADAGLSTQFLCGDAIRVFDEADDWAWVVPAGMLTDSCIRLSWASRASVVSTRRLSARAMIE